MSDEDSVLQQKADYFFTHNQDVHVKFKKKYYKQGSIKKVNSEFFLLDEFKDGEIPVFFLEIEDLKKLMGNNNAKGN